MSRAHPYQATFNAGELSPLLDARVDMAKYGNGCHRLRNFIPLPQGPAMRRPATRFVQPIYHETERAWLVRFQFSPTQSFILEFGGGWIRFFADGGAVLEAAKTITGITAANPPVVTSNAHGYANGDTVYVSGVVGMTEVNGGPYTVGAVAANTFTLVGLDASAFTAYASGGTARRAYQITSPWATADLTNADGTFALSLEQTGDVIFIAGGGKYPRKLTRLGTTNWTLAEADIVDGPFEDVDPDETRTVYASAATGSGITLTASAAIFTAEKVGTLFLLEQKKIDAYKVWEVGKAIIIGDERRSDSNVYRALNAANTGSVKPTHRVGARFDGDAGVQWQYVHSGYGMARITAVAGDALSATADVVHDIPSDAVLVGNASTKWAFSAWDSVLGYPTHCTIHRERLHYFRKTQVWASVPGDFENFAARDGAETLPDSALVLDCAGKDITDVIWVASADDLLVGTSACEYSLTTITSTDPYGPGNVRARKDTTRGSRGVAPVIVGGAVLFVQATGRRVQNSNFNLNVDRYDTTDMTVLAEHIAKGQIIQMAYAQEPHSIIWCCCADGSLIALTYLPEQEVMGWHRHETGGGFVESVACVKDATGTFDQLWMSVRRTINGQTRRYIEYMAKEWDEDEDDVQDAQFSDCGATFDGAITGASITLSGSSYGANDNGASIAISGLPIRAADVGDYLVLRLGDDEARVEVTSTASPQITVKFVTALPASMQEVAITDLRWARDVISGLGYLEGEEVTLTVEGASHPRCTVSGGAITLQGHYHHVEVGLPAPCELVTMRIEAGGDDGTAQGKKKRLVDLVLRLLQSMGGKVGPEGSEETLQFRTSADPLNAPPAPYTGDKHVDWPDGYETDARIRYYNDQPLPVTLVGLYPEVVVGDRR